MSFDPSMNLGYMSGAAGWLATNSFIQQVGGLYQGTLTTALAAALLNRHKGLARTSPMGMRSRLRCAATSRASWRPLSVRLRWLARSAL